MEQFDAYLINASGFFLLGFVVMLVVACVAVFVEMPCKAANRGRPPQQN